jgi:hypothetical protein
LLTQSLTQRPIREQSGLHCPAVGPGGRGRLTRSGVGALALVLALAAPVRAEDWYEAYQDGLRALARGDGRRAAALLGRAIQKRPEPGVNLPTYGTNVEERYFPYLRLAEASLLTGDHDAAARALERSAAFGKEPAEERSRLAARLAAAIERVKPPPTPLPATTTTTLPAPTTTVTTTTLAPSVESAPAAPPPTSPSARALPLPPATLRPNPSPSLPAPEASSPQPGALEVYSQPPGALVILDDEPLGRTDPQSGRLVKGGLAPGPHRLRLSLEGHAELVQELEVRSGAVATFRGALSAVPEGRGLRTWTVVPLGVVGLVVLVLAGRALSRRWRQSRPEREAETPARPLRSTPMTPGLRGPATPVDERRTPEIDEDQPLPFGPFLLHRRLGRGGMAAVYKAERQGEFWALKRPLADHLEDPQFLERFLREAEIGRTLYHPNIVRIFERGEVDNVPYFTMELIEGETLHAKVQREGALAPRAAARLVAQVAEALDYAHHKGVVHRDLKPSNIMVLPDGTAKVMDYGIARARRFVGLTTTGAFLGTPDYVAPEIIEGAGSDARSDLYSLGIVFFEALAGRVPFKADTPFAVLRKHCTEEPGAPSAVRPEVPPELDAMVLRLLRKKPDDRYATAEELLVELQGFLSRN